MRKNLFQTTALTVVILGIIVFGINKIAYSGKQAQTNIQQNMEIAVQKEDVTKLKILLSIGDNVDIKDRYGWTLLMLAARDGKTESASVLLDNGADPNAYLPGIFPLRLAASRGHLEIVERLLARGALVNGQSDYGNIALIEAAGGGYYEIVKLLAAYGANVNAVTETGNTALMLVYDKPESVDTLVTLIRLGADINVKDSNGWTPLFYAVRVRRHRHVQTLLESGADVNSRSIHGQTVLDLAILLKDEVLIEALKDAGAELGRGYDQ